jgi:Mrp family chromosome partitioning ATPase
MSAMGRGRKRNDNANVMNFRDPSMNQSVTSSKGRQWLTNLTPASTSFEALEGELNADAAIEQLPQIPVAEVIEVTIPSRELFHTQSLHHQLQGIGKPAVSTLSELEIPVMKNPESSSANHEIVFVSIPKLGEDAAVRENLTNHAGPSSDQAPAIDSASGSASYLASSLNATPAMASVAAAFATATDGQEVSRETAHLGDQATHVGADQPEADPINRTPKLVGGEVGILVEKIIDRFPLASPTVLLFVAGEPNPNVDETCAQVASALAACHVGKVLLVDGDVADRQLTIAGGMVHQPGLSEAINRSADWRPLVVSEGSNSFSFLPVGKCPSDRWNSDELLRNVTAEMKREYQFICVSAGDAHAKHAKLWCDVCDGSYLVVSLKNSNETLAKSAAEELMLNGARVLGCVVSDAD